MRLPYKTGTVRVTSPFGERSIDGVKTQHKGIDLVGENKAICAVADGIVLKSRIVTDKNNKTWEWGNYVSVKCDTGETMYYCHMSSRKVKQGQRVKVGDIIGVEGNTGYSTGSHLHFEVRNKEGVSVDPTRYIPVKNIEGHRTAVDDATMVCEKSGLEDCTKTYMGKYKYAEDLWRKLWGAMK